MSNAGNYKNNPLYTDITKLDHLSPQPTFTYNWNTESGRWEPNTGAAGGSVDISNLNELVSGLSGSLNVDLNGAALEGLLSGILSGSLNAQVNGDVSVDLLSGILSGVGSTDTTIDLLSGILSGVENTDAVINIDRIDTQPWKLITKTVCQKIEEDFILLENIPEDTRLGKYSGDCYGVDKFIMDDIFNTHYANARNNPSTPETGHPEYFILPENIDTGRCIESNGVFHTDTAFGLRQENPRASAINSYELKDFSELYELGLAESVLIYNESTYPIQFHTMDAAFDESEINDPENNNIMYLYPSTTVNINTDEARKIYVKRPHTISGYNVKYTITYKQTGITDIIYE
jgi:hypothetical protein